MRKSSVLVGLAVLVAVLAGACDSSSPAGGVSPGAPVSTVRPLEDILASGPVFQDVRPNSVTVRIDTRIPVVCAAAYGTGTSYGSLSTDTDMAGGAHESHHPVLTGLRPGTQYHVRLQGVGPDGTLYVSKDYTVSTPAGQAGEQRPQGDNLALASKGARIAGVSSNYGGGDNNSSYGAGHAIDGDPSTQWSSNGDGNKAWIEIELPSKAHVTAIGFWTRTMGASAQIFSFRIVADGGPVYGPYKLPDASGIHYFATDFTAQRLRFEAVDTSGGNTGAVEIEVYGTPLH